MSGRCLEGIWKASSLDRSSWDRSSKNRLNRDRSSQDRSNTDWSSQDRASLVMDKLKKHRVKIYSVD